MTPMKQPLDLAWERDLMDHIDAMIISMLRRRIEHSQWLQRRKAADGLPVRDPEREAEIIRRYEDGLLGGSAIASVILIACRGGSTGAGPVRPRASSGLLVDILGGAEPPTSADLRSTSAEVPNPHLPSDLKALTPSGTPNTQAIPKCPPVGVPRRH